MSLPGHPDAEESARALVDLLLVQADLAASYFESAEPLPMQVGLCARAALGLLDLPGAAKAVRVSAGLRGSSARAALAPLLRDHSARASTEDRRAAAALALAGLVALSERDPAQVADLLKVKDQFSGAVGRILDDVAFGLMGADQVALARALASARRVDTRAPAPEGRTPRGRQPLFVLRELQAARGRYLGRAALGPKMRKAGFEKVTDGRVDALIDRLRDKWGWPIETAPTDSNEVGWRLP